MIFTYIIAVILIAVCCYFIYKLKKTHKSYSQLLEQNKEETAGALALQEEQHKEATQEVLLNEKQQYEEILNDLMEQRNSDVSKLNHYIRTLERFSIHSGEIMTHNVLLELKNELIKTNKIKPDKMRIMGNVFIPYYTENNELRTRQIDHLVILSTGLYIIETKYWRGKILHGLTKEKARGFSFILDTIAPTAKRNEEETLVFIKTQDTDFDQKAEMRIVSHENPAIQVKTADQLSAYLKQRKIIAKTIVPIVYFGYGGNDLSGVVDYSTETVTKRFSSKKELYHYFLDELSEKETIYNSTDIQEIRDVIENANVLQ